MAIAVTITDRWNDGKRLHVSGTLAFSGNYATGGDTLDFTGKVLASRAPVAVRVEGIAGFRYEVNIGSGIGNSLVLVRGQEPTNATAGVIALTQLAAAAYPAGVTGDTVRFHAIFKLL